MMECNRQNIRQYYTKALQHSIKLNQKMYYHKLDETPSDVIHIRDEFAKYSSSVHDKLLLGLVLLGNGYLDESHFIIQEM